MSKKSKKVRHILSLSGGKDSAALAVYLKDKIPDLEYVFLDTGYELPETYEYLKRMRAILGIKITALKSRRDFDFWVNIFRGCLPSPQNRWCTRKLKIDPYEKHIGSDLVHSYIGIRADENRDGYFSSKKNIIPYYPFIEDELIKSDIIQILEDSGLGLPKYYSWRSRSGCYFCFFQRRHEWIGLYDNHPELFEKACEYESNHLDKRLYTWIERESLKQLLARRDSVLSGIFTRPVKKCSSKSKKLCDRLKSIHFSVDDGSILREAFSSNKQLSNLKEEDEPCLICTL